MEQHWVTTVFRALLRAQLRSSSDAGLGSAAELADRFLEEGIGVEELLAVYSDVLQEAIGELPAVEALAAVPRLIDVLGVMIGAREGAYRDPGQAGQRQGGPRALAEPPEPWHGILRAEEFGQRAAQAIAQTQLHQAAQAESAQLKHAVEERSRLLVREQAARLDAERAEQHLRLLLKASEVLVTTLDHEQTLAEVARLTVPVLADWCWIDLVDADGSLYRLPVAFADPAKAALADELQRCPASVVGPQFGEKGRFSEQLAARPELAEALLNAVSYDAKQREILVKLGYQSAISMPLSVSEKIVGTITLVSAESGYRYSLADCELVEELARRCALAIENALLYAAERQARDDFEQERTILAAILAGMTDGVVMVDLDGQIAYCNTRAGVLLDHDPARLLGQGIQHVFAPLLKTARNPEEASRAWEQALADLDEHAGLEVTLAGPFRRELSVQFFPVTELVGIGLGTGILLRDVAAQHELARVKDEMVAMVNHELRTPLASVVGFTELMLNREFSAAQQRQFLGIMLEEGRRLTRLINNFLDLQRIEAGHTYLALQRTDLRILLERAVQTAGPDPNCPIILDLPADPILVQADADRVSQVLLNLLANARKYSPGGGQVALAARRHGDVVAASVTDQGLGIPPEALPRLFEKFYRVDDPTRRAIQGSGLGLAICREIVEAHGGRIWAESAGPGRGARFAFTLPLVSPGSDGPGGQGEPSQPPASEKHGTVIEATVPEADRPTIPRVPPDHSPGRSLRILVVDDEPAFRRMATLLLELDDQSVQAVASAEEALDSLATADFDVVLSDLDLGAGLNGWDLAAQVRRRWPAVGFVLATGWAATIEAAEAQAKGVALLLPKPYTLDDLRRIVAVFGADRPNAGEIG